MHYRLYFNRCFTTTSKLIEQMKNNPNEDTFDIVMSHSMPNHYLQQHTEHFEVEPPIRGKEYADYIASNCETHHVDMLIPRHNVTDLAEHREAFKAYNPMFVATAEIYRLIDNKVAIYEDLQPTGIVPIPHTHIVSSYDNFITAYQSILDKGSKACIKPISGIGGEGFKRILDDMSELSEAFLSSASALSFDRIARVLRNNNEFTPFMMSEFMEDDEFSIDCLAKDGELIIGIPRRKIDSYRQNIEYREELIEIARKIAKRYNLSYLFNVQVKYHRGLPYLVEINTRFSGGMYKVGATGANMLYWAIQVLKGEEPNIPRLRWNIQAFDTLEFKSQPI
jgi:biotin carboxylase